MSGPEESWTAKEVGPILGFETGRIRHEQGLNVYLPKDLIQVKDFVSYLLSEMMEEGKYRFKKENRHKSADDLRF